MFLEGLGDIAGRFGGRFGRHVREVWGGERFLDMFKEGF